MFPFRYDGVDYNECTSVDAANPGNVWCATEVAREFNNTVIDGRWGDCAESCPGASKFRIDALHGYWIFFFLYLNIDFLLTLLYYFA